MNRSFVVSILQVAAVALALSFTVQANAQSGSSAISSGGSSFGAPIQSFGSGSSFAAPVQSFSAPVQSFGSGSSFAAPVQSFSAPAQSFQSFPAQSFNSAPVTSPAFSSFRSFGGAPRFSQQGVGFGLFNQPQPIFRQNGFSRSRFFGRSSCGGF